MDREAHRDESPYAGSNRVRFHFVASLQVVGQIVSRIANFRRIKIHRPYTIEEAARACGAHRNTVRNWIKRGLAVCDGKRPILILGRVLFEYLRDRRSSAKRPCGPGYLYCVRCRAPRPPAEGMLEYQSISETGGNLVAICADCETLMYRRVRLVDVDRVRGDFAVTAPNAQRHIGEIELRP